MGKKKIGGGGRRQVKIPETSLQPDLDKNRLTAQPANIRPVHSGQEYVVQTGHLQPKKEKALEQDTTHWQGTLSSADPRVKAAQSSPPRSRGLAHLCSCMSRWTPSPQLKRYLEDEHRTRESVCKASAIEDALLYTVEGGKNPENPCGATGRGSAVGTLGFEPSSADAGRGLGWAGAGVLSHHLLRTTAHFTRGLRGPGHGAHTRSLPKGQGRLPEPHGRGSAGCGLSHPHRQLGDQAQGGGARPGDTLPPTPGPGVAHGPVEFGEDVEGGARIPAAGGHHLQVHGVRAPGPPGRAALLPRAQVPQRVLGRPRAARRPLRHGAPGRAPQPQQRAERPHAQPPLPGPERSRRPWSACPASTAPSPARPS